MNLAPSDPPGNGALEARAAARRFLSASSVEVVPREVDPVGAVHRHLPPGTEVYVACIPGAEYERSITLAAQLARAGFVPVPHLAARGVPSRALLDEHLRRLAGEAGADRLLLIGGDVADDRIGPFASSLEVLRTGLLARHRFRRVGFATYPEAHPHIPTPVLETELRAKLAAAGEAELEPWLVSQFCYDIGLIVEHARHLRAMGIVAPLHVGASGPTSWAAMAKFAMICGFTNFVRHLTRNPARFGHLLTGVDPKPILLELADRSAKEPALGLAGPHFFSFGGSERTAGFIKSLAVATA